MQIQIAPDPEPEFRVHVQRARDGRDSIEVFVVRYNHDGRSFNLQPDYTWLESQTGAVWAEDLKPVATITGPQMHAVRGAELAPEAVRQFINQLREVEAWQVSLRPGR